MYWLEMDDIRMCKMSLKWDHLLLIFITMHPMHVHTPKTIVQYTKYVQNNDMQ